MSDAKNGDINMATEKAAEERALSIMETLLTIVGNKVSTSMIVMELKKNDWEPKMLEGIKYEYVFPLKDATANWLVGAAKIVFEKCSGLGLKTEIVRIPHEERFLSEYEQAMQQMNPDTYTAIQITYAK